MLHVGCRVKINKATRQLTIGTHDLVSHALFQRLRFKSRPRDGAVVRDIRSLRGNRLAHAHKGRGLCGPRLNIDRDVFFVKGNVTVVTEVAAGSGDVTAQL